MKIGIYGGSFNPPHKMHKKIVMDLIKHEDFDKIIIVPTGDKYRKEGLLAGIDRYNMLCQIFKKNDDVYISSYEINEKMYTINTMNYYKKKFPKADLYFICGLDNLAQITKWYKYEELLKNFKLFVVKRDTHQIDEEIKKFKKYKDRIVFSNIKPCNISSTKIREEIVKRGYTKKLKDYLYVDTINYLKKINAKDFWRK